MKQNNHYTIEQIKKWRKEQFEQGNPSGLRDFYIAHGSCPDCRSLGGWHHDKTLLTDNLMWVDCPKCNGTGKVQP